MEVAGLTLMTFQLIPVLILSSDSKRPLDTHQFSWFHLPPPFSTFFVLFLVVHLLENLTLLWTEGISAKAALAGKLPGKINLGFSSGTQRTSRRSQTATQRAQFQGRASGAVGHRGSCCWVHCLRRHSSRWSVERITDFQVFRSERSNFSRGLRQNEICTILRRCVRVRAFVSKATFCWCRVAGMCMPACLFEAWLLHAMRWRCKLAFALD